MTVDGSMAQISKGNMIRIHMGNMLEEENGLGMQLRS